MCLQFFILHCSLFTSCKTEDDKIVIQQQHQWVDKKVAVVYPYRNTHTKAEYQQVTSHVTRTSTRTGKIFNTTLF